MAENFTDLMKKKYLWISSNATNSKWKNTKRATERHIIIKLLKAKRKESFESREKKKWVITHGKPIIPLTADFFVRTVEPINHDIFRVLK